MKRSIFVLATILVAGITSPVFAQPRPAGGFDASGWTLLGTQSVDGRRDRDTITVGRYQGRFDQLTLVVNDSDLELADFTIVFANGDKWTPKLKHSFKEGQRSRAIDLPGDNRVITQIELAYANVRGGGRASVSVYGRDRKATPPPPPAPGPVFDPKGWTLLGSHAVDGRRDRDTIRVGRYQGRFDQLTMVVNDSDIDLGDFVVVFGNGERWSPALKHVFKEGQRSRTIDLPGDERTIASIELAYANRPGGGKASVQVYGRDTGRKRPPVFDDKGWTLLGTRDVDGRRDRDTIFVPRTGNYDQLTMVVANSDLELRDFTVVFANGQKWSPRVQHVFKEGQRTRAVDLPGKDRRISRIELAYANLAGGGRASVQVYARDMGRPAPPPVTPVTWDSKGWTFIGKTTVDGWRDRDLMRVNVAGAFTQFMFVVSGSDVELHNIIITFGNREKQEMPSKMVFREGSRTAPIDLAGNVRKINSIEFAYANLPGGGRASLEVWARKVKDLVQPVAPTTPAPPPPPPPPAKPPVVRDHR